MSDVRTCPLCGTNTTSSICAHCAQDLELLGVPLPDPDATPDQIKDWAVEHQVTAFRCGVKGG